MTKENAIKLFNDRKIRSLWDEDQEKWYFSIVDVVGVLTNSPNPNNYWKVLKNRLNKEGSELVTNCNQLKLKSSDGKYYKSDVADTEQLLRLIQSIPSPKAEPFKLWLELVLNMLAEASTTEISKSKKPENFEDSREIAKEGGTIAGNTRKEIEAKTGKKIISRKNAKELPIKEPKKLK